ncbi:MAG TPA: hypothetical protein VMZ53_07280 [Kofleriaceae bacterium]|nr:hypothetical protein [Kofleriaceae bacterium]
MFKRTVTTIVLGALLGACRPKSPHYETGPCEESIRARAAGKYVNQTHAEAEQRNYFYFASCNDLCDDDHERECLELGLLEDDFGVNPAEPILSPLCAKGNKAACDWVAANPEKVASSQNYTKVVLARRAAGSDERPTSQSDLASFAAQLKRAAIGFSTLRDETLSLGGGYTTFKINVTLGRKYLVVCAVEDPSVITARMESGGYTLELEPGHNQLPGVFNVQLSFEAGDAGASAKVFVRSASGPQRSVRCFLLEKD